MSFSSFFYFFSLFFFNDTATTEIYTLSLHDALPIFMSTTILPFERPSTTPPLPNSTADRKSTRLNSSHLGISYAVFCLKKKKKNTYTEEYKTHINKTQSIPTIHRNHKFTTTSLLSHV